VIIGPALMGLRNKIFDEVGSISCSRVPIPPTKVPSVRLARRWGAVQPQS